MSTASCRQGHVSQCFINALSDFFAKTVFRCKDLENRKEEKVGNNKTKKQCFTDY
jgi:hypothetical protein